MSIRSALALVVGFLFVLGVGLSANDDEKRAPKLPTMPELVGRRVDDATAKLAAPPLKLTEVDRFDLSPRDREIWDSDNWTVVSTIPAAGKLLDGRKVRLYYLRNAEYSWFTRHRTMPRIKRYSDALDVEDDRFNGVEELLEYRYGPGRSPDYASKPTSSTCEKRPVSVIAPPLRESAARCRRRDRLDDGYGGQIIGTQPAAGAKLNPGHLLTILVRDEPLPEPEPEPDRTSGGDIYVPDVDVPSVPDVDIPDSLCPTRWC